MEINEAISRELGSLDAADWLLGAEQLIAGGRKCVERTSKRVRESQIRVQFSACVLRASGSARESS
jgi:hypothetical protein